MGELQIPMWDWWIVLYFFVGGIAGGAYFTSAMIELVGRPEDRPIARMGYYIAFPLSLVCAIALIADLGVPTRFYHMMVYSKTLLPWPKWDSAISVGAYALLLFGGFSFLSFIDALVETGKLPWAPFREKYSGMPRKIYSVLGGLSGFFLASYTGVLLASGHIPMWSSNPLLGALFLVSGASTGMATIALGLALTKTDLGEAWSRLKQADNVALVLEIILLVVFVVWLMTSGVAILSGMTGILIIVGVLLIGLIAPLAIQLRMKNMTVIVSLLILIGGFVMRMAIVMGGQGLI
ncbi:MAG: NrfD/PsrC family molybdoenzyme membrane anchor subunit [Chloroflexota bacterium]